MHKELLDRQGANIASRSKEMYSKKLSRRPKKILGGDKRFFAVVLSTMDLANVDIWKV